MEGESLAGLKAAFEEWRSKKRYVREAVPAALLQRARRAAPRHGLGAVARVTKVDQRRLQAGSGSRRARRPVAARAPVFSRVELAAPSDAARPFAEVETAAGLKLRLFAPTTESLALLSSLFSSGGVR
jgi:hypothetical protein